MSIDILRGLTILTMLFVNDVAGVVGTPAWMLHAAPPDADGMTFVDVVFPAFLFIVGMAIPFAFGRRLERGAAPGALWGHILVRTASLLLIGVFMVNSESYDANAWLPKPVWALVMYAGVILVWNRPPPERTGPLGRRGMQALGAALLGVAALTYQGFGMEELVELRPHWWGILGLIGWAYLIACLAYWPLRRSTAGVLGVSALLYLLYFADAGGLFDGFRIPWIGIGGMWGTHAAVTVSGVVLGMALRPGTGSTAPAARIRWALVYAAGLAAAAVMLHAFADLHPAFFYNKIAATPAWGLASAAITAASWALVYWIVDVRRWTRWTPAVAPAGQNALFAFILAPIVYALFTLLARALGFDVYSWLGSSFAVGFWRAVVFAFAMTWLAGWLRTVGVRLRL